MRPPLPRPARWGTGLQVLGALALQAAPFLPYAAVPLLGLHLPVPGVFLHGSALLALGVLALVLAVLPTPRPGLQALLGLVAAGFAAWDLSLVLQRTDAVLGRLQLSLAEVNGVLARLGVEAVEVYKRGADPWDYVGPGLWLALAGAALLAAGAGLETLGHARAGKAAWSVLAGLPRCRECGHGVGFAMAFCPGCGRVQGRGRACPACSEWLEEGYRFCPSCGGSAGGT